MIEEPPKRIVEVLRAVVEKVEQTEEVPPDNLDLVALREIVEKKIANFNVEEPPDPAA